MLGVFDSGLGGLSSVKELEKCLPKEDVVYFGDTGRVPYGTRSKEVICRYAMQDVRFLLTMDVEAVLVACGTVSSNVLEELKAAFSLPFVGVVEPAAKKAAEIAMAGDGKVLVLGTSATVASGAFPRAIRAICPEIRVESVPCPMFVPLVENGFTQKGDVAATDIARRYLAPFETFRPDAMILGCTHFPLLSQVIGDVMPAPVQVSAGDEAASAMAAAVGGSKTGEGKDFFFSSDDPVSFGKHGETFLGYPLGDTVARVNIQQY